MPPCASARNARLPAVEAMATPASKPMSPASLGEVPARRVTLVPFASAVLISASCTLWPGVEVEVANEPTSAPSMTSILGAHRVQLPGAPPPASTCKPRRSKSPPLYVVMSPPAVAPRAESTPNAAMRSLPETPMLPPAPVLAVVEIRVLASMPTTAPSRRTEPPLPVARASARIEV